MRNTESLRVQIVREWRTTTAIVRKYREACLIGLLAASLLFAVNAALQVHGSIGDIPLILLAGVLRSLRYLSIVALIWFWLIAQLTHGAVHQWAEARWIDRKVRKQPNRSFPVPYVRFWIFALVPAAGLFLVQVLTVFYVLWFLPRYNTILTRALS